MVYAPSSARASDCSDEFNRILKQVASAPGQRTEPKLETLDELLEAFADGLEPDLTNPDQQNAFEIYRKMKFGDPNTYLQPDTMERVVKELRQHPKLKKEPFRNIEISFEEKSYPVTDELKSFIDSQIKSSGQVRSNLFNIEANRGYWKKVLQNDDPEKLKALTTMLKANDKQDVRKVAARLHLILIREQSALKAAGKNTKPISQAITDLIHTIGYHDPLIQKNLKSSDGLTRLSAFRKILDERDRFALELGYKNHFKQVLAEGQISLPSGIPSEKELPSLMKRLEDEVMANAVSTHGETRRKTVRHLSLAESPFRSCLGGSDCSSNTYLTRALDPNYHYFTVTDEAGLSSGHITVVLGEAGKDGRASKIAFIDKVQNVDHSEMPLMMEAVRRSVEEKGYTLALPESLGDHNGISNEVLTRQFIQSNIKTDPSTLITGFEPHPHSYRFRNEYSRAELRLSVRPVLPLPNKKGVVIKPGKVAKPWKTSNFDLSQMAESTLKLKYGNVNDRIRYISSMNTLKKAGYRSDPDYARTLEQWLRDQDEPFTLRKQVLISEWMDHQKPLPGLIEHFSPDERVNLIQNLLDTPRYRNHVLSRKNDLPLLVAYSKSSKKLREQLMHEYLPGYETSITKIVETSDLEPYAMANAIKSIEVGMNALDVEFLVQPRRAVSGSSVEPWVEAATASAFLKNSQGGSSLARGLETALQSNQGDLRRFGEVLIQVGTNSWGVNQPLVEAYRDIASIQRTSGKTLEEAATRWLSGSTVTTESKALFLKNQMGAGDQRFERYWNAVPESQRESVWAKVGKNGNVDVFRKFAKKQGVESELLDHGVPESFEYRPIITPEQAKNGGVKFKMGTGKDAREVTLTRPFEMQATPMTQLQVVLLGGKNKSYFTGKDLAIEINGRKIALDPKRPAEQYNWYDQNEIIKILNENDPKWNYRRPTEAEWEYAAQSGENRTFTYGDRAEEMKFHGWSIENSGGKTHPVAKLRPNAYGLYDMHGNVNQWVEDYFGALSKNPVVDPVGSANGAIRVIKGGNFEDESVLLGISARSGTGAMSELNSAGFRLVREPK